MTCKWAPLTAGDLKGHTVGIFKIMMMAFYQVGALLLFFPFNQKRYNSEGTTN